MTFTPIERKKGSTKKTLQQNISTRRIMMRKIMTRKIMTRNLLIGKISTRNVSTSQTLNNEGTVVVYNR